MSETTLPRIVFMGTPTFSEVALRALHAAQYPLVAVYTKPDKPSGRNQEISKSPVKIFAEAQSIPVEQPPRFDDNAIATLRNYRPDIIVVAAYGKILPQAVLDIPKDGCINIHASMLPRWRGASPIQNALLSGDSTTGITLIKMDAGMDTGPIITSKEMRIEPEETTGSLLPKLAEMGAKLLIDTLPHWRTGNETLREQDGSKATLCQLIEREDGRIFWSEEAATIFNRYRALSPWPGIFSFWKRKSTPLRLKLQSISLQKENPEAKHSLGQVFEISDSIGIQTGKGVVFIREIQVEGKAAMPISDFIRGYPDFIGAILE